MVCSRKDYLTVCVCCGWQCWPIASNVCF